MLVAARTRESRGGGNAGQALVGKDRGAVELRAFEDVGGGVAFGHLAG